jgi:hypothetical protein
MKILGNYLFYGGLVGGKAPQGIEMGIFKLKAYF